MLRVLMLGKNKISLVENLHYLPKLDVLDLHCNLLTKITGLSYLSELRVLNLAGNQIEQLDHGALQGLHALTELNVRRNIIHAISGIECTPSLQRLFLSYNHIGSLDALVPLSTVSGLMEIAIDANPGE